MVLNSTGHDRFTTAGAYELILAGHEHFESLV